MSLKAARWRGNKSPIESDMRPSMDTKDTTQGDRDAVLDTFAAELTDAAYPVALKYGVIGSSLDLELEIWKRITELVRKRGRDLFGAPAIDRVAGAHRS